MVLLARSASPDFRQYGSNPTTGLASQSGVVQPSGQESESVSGFVEVVAGVASHPLDRQVAGEN